METQSLYLRIASDQIYFLKFILEGYDGMGILSTVDSSTGIVVLRYPDAWKEEIFRLLVALGPELRPRKDYSLV